MSKLQDAMERIKRLECPTGNVEFKIPKRKKLLPNTRTRWVKAAVLIFINKKQG